MFYKIIFYDSFTKLLERRRFVRRRCDICICVYMYLYIYLQRIAKNVNDQNANSDGYAGPRDHGRSPFWRRNLRAINGGWDRGHSGRDSGNNSAHKNLLVCSSEINEQPSNDGHDRRYQQAQLSSPPHSVTRYNATEWDAQCCSCGCGLYFFNFKRVQLNLF